MLPVGPVVKPALQIPYLKSEDGKARLPVHPIVDPDEGIFPYKIGVVIQKYQIFVPGLGCAEVPAAGRPQVFFRPEKTQIFKAADLADPGHIRIRGVVHQNDLPGAGTERAFQRFQRPGQVTFPVAGDENQGNPRISWLHGIESPLGYTIISTNCRFVRHDNYTFPRRIRQ